MRPLLIADRNPRVRRQLSQIFVRAGIKVISVDSVDEILRVIVKTNPQVLLLGGDLEPMPLVKLISLLRACSPHMAIILVSDTASLPLIRACRREGIFYHALSPTDASGEEELLQAVRCALRRNRPAGIVIGAGNFPLGIHQ